MLGFCLGGGGGFGIMIMPLIGAQVLDHAGWRLTYVAVGAIAAVIGLIATALLPPDVPAGDNAGADKSKSLTRYGIEGRVARKSTTFLMLIAGTLLTCMVLNGTLNHLAAILTDAGMTNTEAALAMSVYAFAMIVGQFGIGVLSDRFGTPRIFLPVLGVALAGLFFLHGSPGKLAALAGAACIGASAGSEYGLLPYMVTRYFGQRSFGQLYGLIYAAAAMGTGIGPYAMGAAYDLTGSYDDALLTFGCAVIAVIVLFARLPRYTFAPSGAVDAITENDGEKAPAENTIMARTASRPIVGQEENA